MIDAYISCYLRNPNNYSSVVVLMVQKRINRFGIEGKEDPRFTKIGITPVFVVISIDRLKGVSYRDVFETMKATLENPDLGDKKILDIEQLVDCSETGIGIVEVAQQIGLFPTPVVISRKIKSHYDEGTYIIARPEVLSAVQDAVQYQTLQSATGLEYEPVFRSQIAALEVDAKNNEIDGDEDVAMAVGQAIYLGTQQHRIEETYEDRLYEESSAVRSNWDPFELARGDI